MPDAAVRPALPAWAESIRQKYLAGEASTFVLHRNVFDTYLIDGELLDLTSYLLKALFVERKGTICEVSLDKGVRVLANSQPPTGMERGLPEYDAADLATLVRGLNQLDTHMRRGISTAMVVPYADLLLPAGDPSFSGHVDRQAYLIFHRWSIDRALSAGDNIILLVAESLGALNGGLLANPGVAAVEIPMPDLEARRAVIALRAPTLTAAQRQRFAERTAGLRSVQLAGILSNAGGHGPSEDERFKTIRHLLADSPDADARARSLAAVTAGKTLAEITYLIEPDAAAPVVDADAHVIRVIDARKREIIEKECAGLIEFVTASHGLEAVGGHEPIKAELLAIAQQLKSGDRKLAPMGLLAVGPMGAGKTFVIKAFLKEAGLTGVALKNFRSKWVGATESNLERVLATVKAMGPIAVIIDEGDRSFGSGGEDTDGGTSSRIIARLKEFMADTENRGQVLFVMMTNRPDKLDTDIKRPGRLDRKIPFFYAQTAAERVDVLRAILGRYGIATDLTDDAAGSAGEKMEGYSNADIEAVALLAAEYGRASGVAVGGEAIARALGDFMPPQERDMIRFMELLAVSEASRRSLLPAKYQGMTIESIQEALADARRRALTRH